MLVVKIKSMFSSNTAEIINFEKQKTNNDVFTKILFVHKKLKEIAKHESNRDKEYKIASLSSEQVNKIKTLESTLGFNLVAYEVDEKLKQKKVKILDEIYSLLDEYLSIYNPQLSKKNECNFNEFFEQ